MVIAIQIAATVASAPPPIDRERNLAEMMRRTPAQERWYREQYRDGAKLRGEAR